MHRPRAPGTIVATQSVVVQIFTANKIRAECASSVLCATKTIRERRQQDTSKRPAWAAALPLTWRRVSALCAAANFTGPRRIFFYCKKNDLPTQGPQAVTSPRITSVTAALWQWRTLAFARE